LIKQFKRNLKDLEHRRNQTKSFILFAAGVVVLALIAGYFFRQSPASPPAGRMDVASDFPRGIWFNTPEPLSLYDQLRGHVVVVLFNDFNTLSDLEDLSQFGELTDLFSDQSVFGLVVMAGRETVASDSLISQWQIDFPVLVDPDSAAMASFGIRALPAVLVIDARARVAARYYEDWQTLPLEAVVQDLVDQGIATRSLASEKYSVPEAAELP
jgi:peroxiredoxin